MNVSHVPENPKLLGKDVYDWPEFQQLLYRLGMIPPTAGLAVITSMTIHLPATNRIEIEVTFDAVNNVVKY